MVACDWLGRGTLTGIGGPEQPLLGPPLPLPTLWGPTGTQL